MFEIEWQCWTEILLEVFLSGLEMFENVSRLTNSKWIWVIAMELCQRNNFNLYLTCVRSNTTNKQFFGIQRFVRPFLIQQMRQNHRCDILKRAPFSCTWKLFSDTFFCAGCAVVFNLHNHPSSTKKTECRAESVEQKFTIHKRRNA